MGQGYEGLNFYEYRDLRRQERKLKTTSRKKLSEEDVEIREGVWNALLNNFDGEYNAYQYLRRHTYIPKAHPDDVEGNEGIIEVYESQRKFMQYKNFKLIPGETLSHLDLKSAYATSLAGLDKSLKFFMSYHLIDFVGITDSIKDNYYSVLDIKLEMPYHPVLNLYTTNERMVYNGKKVSDSNRPKIGETIKVTFKLANCENLKIHHLHYFLADIERELLDYDVLSIKVSVYDLIDREPIYEYETLLRILENMKTMDKSIRTSIKSALVSFTGMLMNIDPGRRAIMLARCEEVMHRIRNYMLINPSSVEVMGVQIDAIYYRTNPEYEEDFKRYSPPVYHEIITSVYDIPKDTPINWLITDEVFGPHRYKETPFRLQEVR